MNRRIFFKRASQALAGVAASLAIGKFTEPKLLWEGNRNNSFYFSHSKDWLTGTFYPGGVWSIHSDANGRFREHVPDQLRYVFQALVARNYQPHMTVDFAYNKKTGQVMFARRA